MPWHPLLFKGWFLDLLQPNKKKNIYIFSSYLSFSHMNKMCVNAAQFDRFSYLKRSVWFQLQSKPQTLNTELWDCDKNPLLSLTICTTLTLSDLQRLFCCIYCSSHWNKSLCAKYHFIKISMRHLSSFDGHYYNNYHLQSVCLDLEYLDRSVWTNTLQKKPMFWDLSISRFLKIRKVLKASYQKQLIWFLHQTEPLKHQQHSEHEQCSNQP